MPGGKPLYTYAVTPVAGPHVASVGAGGASSSLSGITVTFSGPVDPATFTAADMLSLTGPDGNPIAVDHVDDISTGSAHNVFRIVFSASQATPGFYSVSFGPNISDYSGNRMDQNQNALSGGANGELPGDIYSGRFLFQPGTNSSPVLNGASAPLPDLLEDTGPNPGIDLPTFLGSTVISDPDDPEYSPGVAPRGIAITGVDDSHGIWQYSIDGGNTWVDLTAAGPLSDNVARALENVANNWIRFIPDPNYNSAILPSPSFTFRAWDLTSGLTVTGLDNTLVDTSVNGGTTAYSSTTAAGIQTVIPVNDVPSFTKGSNQTTLEDSGLNIVSGWATNVLAGPPDEVAAPQALNFLISTNNDALFLVLPAIAPDGTLSYTLADNANGSAVVTVELQDDGGTANGGVDTSAQQTFVITVTAVNDPPSFTEGPDQTVLEDAGPRSVPNWATGVSAGPPDESGQTVSFVVTGNTNPGLFAVAPAISSSGTLTYTTAPNANGAATITVLARDNGGTTNGGVDSSPPQTFVITVTPVNDPPTFSKGPDQTVLEESGAQTVPNWATAISAGPPDESGQSVTFAVTGNTNPGLFAVAPSVSPTGTLTYTPAPNTSGTATITLVAQDDGGTANGGVDTSVPQTFVITVTAVNDPPSFTEGPDQTVLEDAGPRSVPNWATGVSAGPPDESGQTVSFVVTGNTNPGLFAVAPAISSSGTLTYTTAPNANGAATITVLARDNGGTSNGGVDSSPPQTFVITVTPVNDPPTFSKGPDQTVLEESVRKPCRTGPPRFRPVRRTSPDNRSLSR